MLSGQFQEAKAMQQGKIKCRKIPKISPSMYEASPNKNYKPPGGLYLENCPQIQRKTKQER